ncbi:hypothetical protein V8C37DRAFT_377893 [Trichoderma ceciliae]
MPRVLNQAACDTCRQRKVKCDEAIPICSQCTKAGRYCARPQKPSRFLAYSHPSGPRAASKGAAGRTRFPSPESPRDALELLDVAWYFHNYIAEPATWYDLGDALRQFATKIPELALDEPLLFSAVIALSAEHVSQTTGSKTAREMAGFYHGHCVRRLIQLDEKSELLMNGVALATACLLRSYEILDEDIDPNRHLQGAYSLASCEDSIAGSPSESLLAAGFWNYLREDITFSLFEGCALKMDVAVAAAPRLTGGQDQLHSISLILGQIINKAFSHQILAEWQQLVGMVQSWLDELPLQVKPFSKGRSVTPSTVDELPHLWFLQDFHASARQYALTSLSILVVYAPLGRLLMLPRVRDDIDVVAADLSKADLLEALALEICGIAFTANIPSVLVNSFGPIAYCGKFIRSEAARHEVIRRLSASRRLVGWPVERLVASLEGSWTAAELLELESPTFPGEAGPSPGSSYM